MLLGVLYIGSISAQLMVVDTERDTPLLPACRIKRRTLLGDAIEPDGSIGEAGIARLIRALDDTVGAGRDYGVEQLCVVVTATVRDATNRDLVLSRLERESGIRPQFLSGEDEARLACAAARYWRGSSAGRLVLLSISGGTMEIATGIGGSPDFVASLPLGAGRLSRVFLKDDPPTRQQLRSATESAVGFYEFRPA